MLIPVTPAGPEQQSQFQPFISTSPIDCVPCTVRKLIRRATLDAKAPTTKAIRAATGITTRGLSYGEGAEAAAHWGVKLVPSYGNDPEEMADLVDGGHACAVSIDCSETVNTDRATNSFTGDHTLYVHDIRHVVVGGKCLCEKKSAAKAHNEYLIEDPGNSSKGYEWWSSGLVYKAALARTTDKNGVSHGINLLVAPDTEDVSWKGAMTGGIRTEPRRDAPKLANVVIGKTYHGRRTQTGDPWERADGTEGVAWVQVEYATGKYGFGRGEAFVHA